MDRLNHWRALPSSPVISNEEEINLLPQTDDHASLIIIDFHEDGSLTGMTLVLDMALLKADSRVVIGSDLIAGGVWTFPAGGTSPDAFSPFTEGVLELSSGGTTGDATIAGTFSGVFGDPSSDDD